MTFLLLLVLPQNIINLSSLSPCSFLSSSQGTKVREPSSYRERERERDRDFNVVALQAMAITGSESQQPTSKANPPGEVQCVKCDSCGFTEDCTLAYISRVRERYQGRWICGLCVEAVKDEVSRSDRLISTEEALNRHINFCKQFRSSSLSNEEAEHPISAIGRILRRSLDSPRAVRSNSSGSLGGVERVHASSLVRSGSCFSSLST